MRRRSVAVTGNVSLVTTSRVDVPKGWPTYSTSTTTRHVDGISSSRRTWRGARTRKVKESPRSVSRASSRRSCRSRGSPTCSPCRRRSRSLVARACRPSRSSRQNPPFSTQPSCRARRARMRWKARRFRTRSTALPSAAATLRSRSVRLVERGSAMFTHPVQCPFEAQGRPLGLIRASAEQLAAGGESALDRVGDGGVDRLL